MLARFHRLLGAVQVTRSVFISLEPRPGVAGDFFRYGEVTRLAEASERWLVFHRLGGTSSLAETKASCPAHVAGMAEVLRRM